MCQFPEHVGHHYCSVRLSNHTFSVLFLAMENMYIYEYSRGTFNLEFVNYTAISSFDAKAVLSATGFDIVPTSLCGGNIKMHYFFFFFMPRNQQPLVPSIPLRFRLGCGRFWLKLNANLGFPMEAKALG